MEIKKIENCNYVMFPRLQHCGLKPEHVNRVHNGPRDSAYPAVESLYWEAIGEVVK